MTIEAVVIGAGPYGLAAAAHLRAAQVETCVFGEPMGFWRQNMPIGMLLRSPWRGSNIADPRRALTLDRCVATGRIQQQLPISLDDFIIYGEWFQENAVPDLDRRRVARVERAPEGFRLELEDGARIKARSVVVATGLLLHTRQPAVFDGLPIALASHSSEHTDFARFTGKSVVVVGAGQSALESAALLREAGAEVEIIARRTRLYWRGRQEGAVGLAQNSFGHLPAPAQRLLRSTRQALIPPTEVGPWPQNWLIEFPDVFKLLPYGLQENVAARGIRPAGAGWLRPRLSDVRVTLGRTVVHAASEKEQLRLVLDDGTERRIDHTLLATGYHVKVVNYPFLDRELVEEIASADGHPLLSRGFQSSVPGLYFVGAAAARSFGPLMRFVGGTTYVGPVLARDVRRNLLRARASRTSPVVQA